MVLVPAVAAHCLNWLRDNDAIWRRGSGKYKDRHKLWREYAAEHGLEVYDLEKWYKNKRDTYVKTKKILSRTDTIKTYTPTDNEAWCLANFTFQAWVQIQKFCSNTNTNISFLFK